MEFRNPIPGLLGMNNQQPDPYQSLLGGYYTPQQAKMAWLGGSLQGLGAGLASGKSGAWAQGLALGGGEGLDNYRQRAVAASALDMRKQDQDWQMQERQRQSNEQQAQAEARDAWLANPDDEGLFAQAYPTQYATQKAKSLFPDQQGGSSSWGMSVVPVRNKRTGELAAGQFNQGSGGIFVNGQPADPSEWSFDPGQLSQEKASGTAIGKTQGGAIADLPGATRQAEITTAKITELESDPTLDAALGWTSYLPDAAVNSNVIAVRGKVDELMGGAFLEARTMLKGGGQITDYEGMRAERAYARMERAMQAGDPKVFRESLADFRQAVADGVSKLRATATGGAPAAPASPAGGGTQQRLRFNPQSGELE
jgi:hypothetical protein